MPTILDTETTGFHGIIVLIQAAIGDEEPQLWCPWTETVKDSLEWMEHYLFNPNGIIGFNLTFDWFHLQKMWNILNLFKDRYGKYEFPEDFIDEIASLEKEARFGECIKPHKALDLMLYAQKGVYQSLMDRKDIRIKRIPYSIAEDLVSELNSRVVLNDVYFSRKSDPSKRWQIQDIRNDLGEVIPDIVDVVLKFAPSSGLKALAIDAGFQDSSTRLHFEDVGIPKDFMSNEDGWAPFATAPFELEKGKIVIPSSKNWHGRWPEHLKYHIQHWAYNEQARTYAAADIDDTRGLWNHFGRPSLGDDDSELACMVGATRWRGFSIDREKLQNELTKVEKRLKEFDFNFNSPEVCRRMLERHMSPELRKLIPNTSKEILEDVSKWKEEEVCNDCFGSGCSRCDNGLIKSENDHPAAVDAKSILDARRAFKRRGDILKLISTDRFHPDFNIIGAKSGRMSGTGGLNAQGINSSESIRDCFTLADDDEVLSGGDFDAFEVTIADATYNDPALRQDLLADTKIHAIMGSFLYDLSYEDVLKTKGKEGDKDKYAKGKSSIFALFYGGNEATLVRRSGVSLEKAQEAYRMWVKKYPVMGAGRQKVVEAHTCILQPKGIGTEVSWREPAEYVESMFGFRRYFTIENKICRVLYELANEPPKSWKHIKGMIQRRDKVQTPIGAVRSALYGAAFAIMSANVRAALNHKIQSSGATPMKRLQRMLWDLQPVGSNPWKIRNMQVHDEILVVSKPELTDDIVAIKDAFLEEYKKHIPLLNITWLKRMSSWANTH